MKLGLVFKSTQSTLQIDVQVREQDFHIVVYESKAISNQTLGEPRQQFLKSGRLLLLSSLSSSIT